MKLTIAIPTYNRGAILADTIQRLLALEPRADEILIVDQTRTHPPEIAAKLAHWHATAAIRHITLPEPSIPHAMNIALQQATHDLVLFLDDDLIPSQTLVAAHLTAYTGDDIWAVSGQVLQPGEEPSTINHQPPATSNQQPATQHDLEFPFHSAHPAFVRNVMAGNLSVRRERALAIGGFDENYIGAAYRFETDFALRLTAAGGKIRFEPRASIRHLKLATGGLRALGDHRSSPTPLHAVGDYYYALTHRTDFARYALTRMRKNILTRWHLRHPWAIPTKLIGELRGLLLARRLRRRGNVRRGGGLPGTTD